MTRSAALPMPLRSTICATDLTDDAWFAWQLVASPSRDPGAELHLRDSVQDVLVVAQAGGVP